MPIFLQENQELKDRRFKIPKNVLNHLNATLSSYGQYKESDGYKRLNSLVNPNYNNRKDNELEGITFSDLKRIVHDFNGLNDPKDLRYILNGGSVMKDWANNELKQARNSVAATLKKKKSDNIKKSELKPTKDPMKPIKMADNSSLHIHEDKKTIYLSEEQLLLLKNI